MRTAVERHKGRLQAEFTKARIRRKLSSPEAFKAFIEAGLENQTDSSEAPYPRWIRINTLKTTLEDQLDTTFTGYEQVTNVEKVRYRFPKRIFIDGNIPNLLAVSPNSDVTKSEAYKSGAIIFQDKASCFPAYLLDPLPEDGDIIDSCSAPGNKTTHIAAILLGHSSEPDECSQTIHAFEKNKGRAETLEKMVNLAGSETWTKLHPGQDFLKADPTSSAFKNVGALLLDPSCSGSGIVGRDEMPELYLPVLKEASHQGSKGFKKTKRAPDPTAETRKRKRDEKEEPLDVMVDDDGEVTAVNSEDELKSRLEALSKFQLELLLHSFKFPAAKKITYSTCSIHAGENENVVRKALEHPLAKEGGWRILKREEQIRGMREWPVRGSPEACDGDEELAEACIRANKGDEHGTMGFFLAGFTRGLSPAVDLGDKFLRDEEGRLVRDVMGFPVKAELEEEIVGSYDGGQQEEKDTVTDEIEEEWGGFEDEDAEMENGDNDGRSTEPTPMMSKPIKAKTENQHKHSRNRPNLGIKREKKRKKSKSSG